MSQEIKSPDLTPFEQIKKLDDNGKEVWSSRDLAKILDYSEYRNFQPVIKKAQQACFNSMAKLEEHFVSMHAMQDIGNNAKREVEDIALSRYACYLIAQNADPAKPIVAKAQTYFALQTRLQEINDQEKEGQLRITLRQQTKVHNKRLAGAAKDAGVINPTDYAIFQNCGYMGLYGGLTKQDIHSRKNLKKGEEILDHMGSTELAANLFRATQAEDKIRRENIMGKENANTAHREVGSKVRATILDIGGTMPENLPVAENIKKVEAKHRKALKSK